MRTFKVFFSIFLLFPFILQCMEQMRAPQQSITATCGIKPEDIKTLFIEPNNDYLTYCAILSNGKQIIARKDKKGHIDCCCSIFPRENPWGLDETELQTYYFGILEQLYKQQQQK